MQPRPAAVAGGSGQLVARRATAAGCGPTRRRSRCGPTRRARRRRCRRPRRCRGSRRRRRAAPAPAPSIASDSAKQLASFSRRTWRAEAPRARSRSSGRPLSHVEFEFLISPVAGEIAPGVPTPTVPRAPSPRLERPRRAPPSACDRGARSRPRRRHAPARRSSRPSRRARPPRSWCRPGRCRSASLRAPAASRPVAANSARGGQRACRSPTARHRVPMEHMHNLPSAFIAPPLGRCRRLRHGRAAPRHRSPGEARAAPRRRGARHRHPRDAVAGDDRRAARRLPPPAGRTPRRIGTRRAAVRRPRRAISWRRSRRASFASSRA